MVDKKGKIKKLFANAQQSLVEAKVIVDCVVQEINGIKFSKGLLGCAAKRGKSYTLTIAFPGMMFCVSIYLQ